MLCELEVGRNKCVSYDLIYFSWHDSPPSGPGLPHYQGFTITLRHTTLLKTPLDEWSARHRDLCLKTHNTQTSMPPSPPAARFEPVIPANERPHWDRHNLNWALLFCHIWRIWNKQRRTSSVLPVFKTWIRIEYRPHKKQNCFICPLVSWTRCNRLTASRFYVYYK